MKEQLMRFRSAFIKDDEMWCVPRNLNRLFKINLVDWSVKNVCDLGVEDEGSFEFVLQHEDYVWCIASIGTKVIGYNMKTDEVEHFEVKADGHGQRNIEVILYNDMLWLVPIEISYQMICFSLKDKKFSICTGWEKGCQEKGRLMPGALVNNVLYMVILNQNKVVCFNLLEQKMKVEELPGEFSFHYMLQFQEQLYVITNADRKLIRWNEKTGEIKIFNGPYMDDKQYDYGCEFEDGILLTDSNEIEFLDVKTGEFYICDSIPGEFKNLGENLHFFFKSLHYDERYFLLPWSGAWLLEFNQKSKEWKGHILEIPRDIFYEDYICNRLKNKRVITEGALSLKDYISDIGKEQKGMRETELQAQAGRHIFLKVIC